MLNEISHKKSQNAVWLHLLEVSKVVRLEAEGKMLGARCLVKRGNKGFLMCVEF